MNVLVACEFSGEVRRAFEARGHFAWSCDLLPAEDGSPRHIQRDIREVLSLPGLDMLIAHPPCTRLANSGVRWLHERDLWAELDEAAAFFKLFLNSDIPRICVENPIPHRYAVERVGRLYDQTIQPWQFWAGEPGTGEIKRTCFWLKGLPKLTPTTPQETGRHPACWLAPPSKTRWMDRSRTYPGIAHAMAEQWGGAQVAVAQAA
jgi:hypothetical protein